MGSDRSSLKVAELHTMVQEVVSLNHTVICKYLINTELYLSFSKYVDKLLVMESLINILKFAYFNIVFNIVFRSFFHRCLWSKKSFNRHDLMLVGTFIDTLICTNCLVLLLVKKRYSCLAWDRISVHRNRIKVSMIA